MGRVSDDDMIRMYNSFKQYALNVLRDDNNPNLAPVPFNQMVEPSLSSYIIHLTGVQRVLNYREIDQLLSEFPDGSASLCQEEGIDGKPEYWVEIPIPRNNKRNNNRRHTSYVIDHNKPSCTKLLLLVIVFLVTLMVGVIMISG